jgi:hypothetical protein
MNPILLSAIIGLSATTASAEALSPGTPTGRHIMDQVDARDDGDVQTEDVQMTLIDKRGGERIRTFRAFRRDIGEDSQTILFFLSPADVKDTGVLTYDFDDPGKDDDQWLYLPALKKTKRIASTDKSGSFMGSDFTYADMSDRPLDHYEYKLMEETEVGGVKVWQVEGIPTTEREIAETGYTKSIFFVRQDNHFVVRAVHWLRNGTTLKYYEVTGLQQVDGIWVATEVHMTTKTAKAVDHRTILKAQNIRFNQELAPDHFSVRKLEAGL